MLCISNMLYIHATVSVLKHGHGVIYVKQPEKLIMQMASLGFAYPGVFRLADFCHQQQNIDRGL